MYIVVEYEGIYEVIKVDKWTNCIVVQTNIRTKEKADEACKIWKEREWLKNQTSPSKANELPTP